MIPSEIQVGRYYRSKKSGRYGSSDRLVHKIDQKGAFQRVHYFCLRNGVLSDDLQVCTLDRFAAGSVTEVDVVEGDDEDKTINKNFELRHSFGGRFQIFENLRGDGFYRFVGFCDGVESITGSRADIVARALVNKHGAKIARKSGDVLNFAEHSAKVRDRKESE